MPHSVSVQTFSSPCNLLLDDTSRIEAQCLSRSVPRNRLATTNLHREIDTGRQFTLALLLRRRRRARRGAAGVEVIPVQDRVEGEKEIELRLPAPERTIREQDE